jgi:crotonobetainyl-CoA:carnitine CoA-transferase CaiB-like acyl-CoA transferase
MAELGRPVSGPLKGVRVLDFTRHAAGPYATFFLTLLGAECIKIESAQQLDVGRRPHLVYGRHGPAEFEQPSANKLSATLNLKEERGVALARRLAAVSDVVAECFRPGVMARLGLAYEDLVAVRPDLVMMSISSAGQFGLERKQPGYAPIFSAMGGLGYLTGYDDGPPVELRTPMDTASGMFAALAVVAALVRRNRTGEGCHVDVSAREVATNLIGDAVLAASAGMEVHRTGNRRAYWAPHNVYPCLGEDRWISICVRTQGEWARFAGELGKSEWLDDPRFADAATRWTYQDELDAEVAAQTSQYDRDLLAERLQAARLAVTSTLTPHDLVTDAHLRSRGVITEMAGPGNQTWQSLSEIWRFSESRIGVTRWPPSLGQDNGYVFGDLLGIDADEMTALQADGVIA